MGAAKKQKKGCRARLQVEWLAGDKVLIHKARRTAHPAPSSHHRNLQLLFLDPNCEHIRAWRRASQAKATAATDKSALSRY